MTVNKQMATVQVAIQETTLQALLALRLSSEETLAGVIARLAEPQSCPKDDVEPENASLAQSVAEGAHKYEAGFLDHVLGANALGELYGKLVDALYEVAPEAVANLAAMRSRSRRYVAKEKAQIHPNSPHLATLQTTSGFFISKNVGTEDFIRGTRALCKAADLSFGQDVWFRKNRRGIEQSDGSMVGLPRSENFAVGWDGATTVALCIEV